MVLEALRTLDSILKPVFLHFLNKEALPSRLVARDESVDLAILRVLLLTTLQKFTVNIAPLSDYTVNRDSLTQIVLRLVESEILEVTSSEENIDLFLASRQEKYSRIPDEFPIYFRDEGHIRKFRIDLPNAYSMTDLLRHDILGYSPRHGLAGFALNARQDASAFEGVIGELQKLVLDRSEIAITVGNLAVHERNVFNDLLLTESIRNILTAQYFSHYNQRQGSVNPSGIPGCILTRHEVTHFPHFDIPLLTFVLQRLGIVARAPDAETPWEVLIEIRQSIEHQRFVEHLHAFLNASQSELVNTFAQGPDSTSLNNYRKAVSNRIERLIEVSPISVARTAMQLEEKFARASAVIRRAADRASAANPVFSYAWAMNMERSLTKKFILLTATDTENDAVTAGLKSEGARLLETIEIGESYCLCYDWPNVGTIYNVQSGAGATGSDGSELVTADALKALKPDFVIAVGICFGLNKKKYSAGDVLISSEVVDYETVRLQKGTPRERGKRVPSGTRLMSIAKIVRQQSEASYKIKLGQLVSGQKLVDDRPTVLELKHRFPDALGGEMEGVGLAASASRHGCKEWIIVKGICDWGFGKADTEQEIAANNAVQTSLAMIRAVATARQP